MHAYPTGMERKPLWKNLHARPENRGDFAFHRDIRAGNDLAELVGHAAPSWVWISHAPWASSTARSDAGTGVPIRSS
ncbi:hypothetical protein G6F63_016993 [Rhizopus arrhizus]|nr:hypothetical protein G6F63_016993 [Rhizopus arrhizus]